VPGALEGTSAAGRPDARRRVTGRVWRRLARQPVAVGAGVFLAVTFVVGAVAPRFMPPQSAVYLSVRNHPPVLSGWHLLGTDSLGRDMLVQLLYGLHTSEQSALAATLLATALGVAIGGIAGYYGGWLDAVLMRLGDMLGVFPALMLLLAVYTYSEPVTVWKASIVFGCFLWIPVARVVRAEISSLRGREFVQAALSLGASDRRILLRHLLPNGSGTIIVAATSVLGQIFVLEATLEFFGVGVPSQIHPTIGSLIGDGQRGVFALGEGWWTWTWPAVLLILILVGTNLLGDGIADSLRPRGHR
jgi:peptide/nickel transport system permease protein